MKKLSPAVIGIGLLAAGFISTPESSATSSPQTPSDYYDEIDADSVTDDAFVVDDLISPAMIYYQSIGREHPLFDAFESSDPAVVLDSANVVLSLFPDDVLSLTSRSKAYYYLGEVEKGLQDALQIYCLYNEDMFPNSFVSYIADVDPAMLKRNIGKYTDAYIANPRPAEADFCIRDYLLELSSAEKNLNNRQQAYKIAKLASAIDPDDYSAPLIMSTIQLQNGTPKEALKLLKPFMKDLEYVYPSVFHNYILGLRDSGKSKDAYKLFDKILKYDLSYPIRISYLLDLASLHVANGEYEKGIELFDDMIEDVETNVQDDEEYLSSTLPELYLRRGIAYSILSDQLKDKDRHTSSALQAMATADILKSLSYGGDEDYTGYEVTAYSWLGDRENALKYMKIFEELAPGRTTPAYAILGETEEAIRLLKQDFDNHAVAPVQIEFDPNYVRLRSTPEYKALAKTYRPLELK